MIRAAPTLFALIAAPFLQVRLTRLVTRGSNFDRVEFTTLGRS